MSRISPQTDPASGSWPSPAAAWPPWPTRNVSVRLRLRPTLGRTLWGAAGCYFRSLWLYCERACGWGTELVLTACDRGCSSPPADASCLDPRGQSPLCSVCAPCGEKGLPRPAPGRPQHAPSWDECVPRAQVRTARQGGRSWSGFLFCLHKTAHSTIPIGSLRQEPSCLCLKVPPGACYKVDSGPHTQKGLPRSHCADGETGVSLSSLTWRRAAPGAQLRLQAAAPNTRVLPGPSCPPFSPAQPSHPIITHAQAHAHTRTHAPSTPLGCTG